jgi:hypothetical protein
VTCLIGSEPLQRKSVTIAGNVLPSGASGFDCSPRRLVAARLLTQRKEEGVVGPPAGNGLRDVRGIAA